MPFTGALKGMLEATRTLELLTLGAAYINSSTAFITLKSRVAACCAHQVHKNFLHQLKFLVMVFYQFICTLTIDMIHNILHTYSYLLFLCPVFVDVAIARASLYLC